MAVGATLALLGVGIWAFEFVRLETPLSSFGDFWAEHGQGFDIDDVHGMAEFGKTLRWESIALAIAGVLILLRRSRRYRLVWALGLA
jgi:hypothetical protein